MRHLRFGSSVKKCVARVVDGVVDLLLRGQRYLRDLKFFTRLEGLEHEGLRLRSAVLRQGEAGVHHGEEGRREQRASCEQRAQRLLDDQGLWSLERARCPQLGSGAIHVRSAHHIRIRKEEAAQEATSGGDYEVHGRRRYKLCYGICARPVRGVRCSWHREKVCLLLGPTAEVRPAVLVRVSICGCSCEPGPGLRQRQHPGCLPKRKWDQCAGGLRRQRPFRER